MSMTKPRPTLDPQAALEPCGCPHMPAISRRNFLKAAGAAGIVAGIAGEDMFTRMAFGATPYTGDVLVVLSLRGGFDGLSAIVPAAGLDYTNYANLRPNIAIPSGLLIPLNAQFGMHPAMLPLKPFWDASTFGVVHAVGMEQPNRSHFEAMEEMERAAPGSPMRTGWIDRVLGLRDTGTAFQATQMGSNSAASAFLGPNPELAMYNIDSFNLDGANNAGELSKWDAALRSLNGGAPPSVSAPSVTALDALATAAALPGGDYLPANGANYPDTGLGNALSNIAQLIKNPTGIQVAAVDYGDWDMHVDLGAVNNGWMFDKLTELSASLAAFATDLGPSAMNKVTLVTLTEFGRRAEENGSGGVDHGYGQAVFLLGGGIKGKQVHGVWPGLDPADLIDGDLDGVNDYRLVLAELLEKRCESTSLATGSVFPGIDSTTRLNIAN
jgi:uncharacterized protein (DUF1501 family)